MCVLVISINITPVVSILFRGCGVKSVTYEQLVEIDIHIGNKLFCGGGG